MGELYKKLHGSEKGLGDLILESYDRTTALLAERKLRARASDPNAQVASLMDFTLSGVNGDPTEAGIPERQDHHFRFLGHLVRALPRAASALRTGEAPFCRQPRCDLCIRQHG